MANGKNEQEPHLEKDTFVEGEETVEGDVFFNDLMSGLKQALAFERGEATARVTEFVEGERYAPARMTKADLETRRAERNIATRKAKPAAKDKAA